MRLIDIDPIIEKLKNAIYLGNRICEDTANLEAVLADIEAQPTAEKKGKWISEAKGKVAILDEFGNVSCSAHCSECGEWLTASDEYSCRGNYCPNCGARMEES